MTETTSPNNWALPSVPPEPTAISTGPVASRAGSPSSSTRSQSPAEAQEYAEKVRAELAARMRKLRLSRRWTTYDVERHSGVSRSTLSRIERNLTEPTASVLVRVCEAYGYPAAQLLADAEACARSAAGKDTRSLTAS
ncbi:helix-turn-helix domain-containing protein [Streptomyces murinus]|uniref:helix-turn-helix domain-containing protein n=1 Tax=Streptomyces murinus TaxID=33900 RepID=UPI003F474C1A